MIVADDLTRITARIISILYALYYIKVQNPSKMRKYLSNVHKVGGAHFQCVNNHYAKFEYKGMKTVGVTDYTNQTPAKHFGLKNV